MRLDKSIAMGVNKLLEGQYVKNNQDSPNTTIETKESNGEEKEDDKNESIIKNETTTNDKDDKSRLV